MESVLVTAVGSFSADIVIKNLKRMNLRVIGCDIYPKEWIVDSYQVHSFYQAPYATEKEEYIEFIKDICVNEKIKLICPLTDIEVDIFNSNREWFIKNNIIICISSFRTVEICRNKKIIEEYIRTENVDIDTIPTEYLYKISQEPKEFPVVLKPFNGRSSQGLKYIKDIDEWRNVIDNINKSKYVVQPYIKGEIITVDIIRRNDDEVVAIPRKELLRTLNGAGTSVYVFNDLTLEKKCIMLANALEILGCVNFEFIVDEHQNYYFIECNPRFSGGVEFSCMVGYNCVSNHVKCFLNETIDKKNSYSSQYISRKYEEYVTCIV